MNTYNTSNQAPDIKKVRGLVVLIFIVVLVFIFGSSMFVTIDSGHAGLLYKTLTDGIDPDDQPMGQGLHFKAPWNKVIDYEIRQQEAMEHLEVLSSNLLKIGMDVTIFYQPTFSKLGYLEVERGRMYKDDVIVPALRSVAREVIAQYLPEEINTTKREELQMKVNTMLTEKLEANYIQCNDILIRNIQLPVTLENAIEKKLQQEQESLEYEFRIEKATKEAERKEIEALGIQKFQEIVTKSITKDLLKWKGIEATEVLAKSNNAKVIVIGSGEGGLPIILGGDN